MDAVVREPLQEENGSHTRFYASGQLMLEEYQTLASSARRYICTAADGPEHPFVHPHRRGSLKESLGTDGQPGNYTDECGTPFHFGHGRRLAAGCHY